jgi:hypothetical protein
LASILPYLHLASRNVVVQFDDAKCFYRHDVSIEPTRNSILSRIDKSHVMDVLDWEIIGILTLSIDLKHIKTGALDSASVRIRRWKENQLCP